MLKVEKSLRPYFINDIRQRTNNPDMTEEQIFFQFFAEWHYLKKGAKLMMDAIKLKKLEELEAVEKGFLGDDE